MDEPTSSLTLSETKRLLELVCELGEQGVSVIYISHRLGEIDECADRVVVLRDGKNAGELSSEESSPRQAREPDGRARNQKFLRPVRTRPRRRASSRCGMFRSAVASGQDRFLRRRARGNSRLRRTGRRRAFGDGQGMVGLDHSPAQGNCFWMARTFPSTRRAMRLTTAFISFPKTGAREGLVVEHDRPRKHQPAVAGEFFPLRPHQPQTRAQDRQGAGGVAEDQNARRSRRCVLNLSGGNQQKVVLGKWLAMSPQGDDSRRADARH